MKNLLALLTALLMMKNNQVFAGEPELNFMQLSESPSIIKQYSTQLTFCHAMKIKTSVVNAYATGLAPRKENNGLNKVLNFDPRLKFKLGKSMQVLLSYN